MFATLEREIMLYPDSTLSGAETRQGLQGKAHRLESIANLGWRSVRRFRIVSRSGEDPESLCSRDKACTVKPARGARFKICL
jgi:hypothetical protein